MYYLCRSAFGLPFNLTTNPTVNLRKTVAFIERVLIRGIPLFIFIFFCAALCIGQTAARHKRPSPIDLVATKNSNQKDSINIREILDHIPQSKGFRVHSIREHLVMGGNAGDAAVADSLGVQTIAKADFDGNGLTDMLLTGSFKDEFSIIVVMDNGLHNGQDRFRAISLTRYSFRPVTFPVVYQTDDGPVIIHFQFPDTRYSDEPEPARVLRADTLIYKFGNFINQNDAPLHHQIDSIFFATEPCFGECPVFDMSINSSRQAIFTQKEFGKPIDGKGMKGSFGATITRTSFLEICSLLDYIDFPKLQNSYRVPWTDDWGCNLTIVYDGGKVKTIHDYGLLGTPGLSLLYDKLLALRTTQKWKRVVPEDH
jgi:hypothetical protein